MLGPKTLLLNEIALLTIGRYQFTRYEFVSTWRCIVSCRVVLLPFPLLLLRSPLSISYLFRLDGRNQEQEPSTSFWFFGTSNLMICSQP